MITKFSLHELLCDNNVAINKALLSHNILSYCTLAPAAQPQAAHSISRPRITVHAGCHNAIHEELVLFNNSRAPRASQYTKYART